MLDVCIALALMTIAVIWMLQGFSQALLSVERSRDEAAALRVLREQAVYAFAQGGVHAEGSQGTGSSPEWRWTITTSPHPDTTSHLLVTQMMVQWQHRRRPQALATSTWLPQLE